MFKHRGKTLWGPRTRRHLQASKKASSGTKTADVLAVDLQAPELCEDVFLMFVSPSLW